MPLTKWVLLGVLIVLVILVLVPVVVTQIENYQARENEQRLQQSLLTSNPANTTAVIVFSRSGNTAVLARHIANQEQADFYRLEAPDYKLGLKGWINAMWDARQGEAVITPATIDLSAYDTIYLGSPIWLYSPAPPIWQFVENNRFDGKDVVLFNTFNSQFKQEFIDTFRQQILAKGAKSFAHRFVQRGRMGQQISIDVMLQRFEDQ